MTVLTLKHRPQTFADVVGQGHVKPVLRAMVASGNVAPALIFSGVRGTGKTTTARIFAAALNCENPTKGDACGQCVSCKGVQSADNDAVLEVDAASNGGVAEVARIKEICTYSHTGKWRVVLLDEAHSMSRDAFNALLKVLEEPPAQTVFVLLTTEEDKILETVRSRAMTFEFRRIAEPEIVSRLTQVCEAEGIEAQESLLQRISAESGGGLRDAVMQLDQCRLAGVSDADGYLKLMGIKDVSLPLLTAAAQYDIVSGHQALGEYFSASGDAARLVTDLSRTVIDCLVLRSGGQVALSEEALSGRKTLASLVDVPALTKAAKLLWDMKDKIRRSAQDPKSEMELGFVLLTEIFHPSGAEAVGTKKSAAPILTNSDRLNLSEVEKMLRGNALLGVA